MKIEKSVITEGVTLSTHTTDKFKSAVMTVSFALPLDKETASGYSLLTNLLSLSTGDYPTMQSFSVIKDELYALGLDAFVQRRSEILLVTLEISTIADSYALNGEDVLNRACRLLAGAIFRPYLVNGVFPLENVESEKRCLIEELAAEIENKPSYAMRQARRIMCENEPFATDAGGEIPRVQELNGADLVGFYNHALSNAPVYIVYVGEASHQYVKQCITENFPFTPRKTVIPQPTVHPYKGEIYRVCEKMEIEQSILNLGFTLKMPESPKDRAILSVYDEIFGGSPASKLFMNVREKEGLCYYCSSYPTGRKNVLFVSCGLEQGNEEKAIKAIYAQVKAMKKGDFTSSDLENAKGSIIRNILSVSSNLSSASGYMLGQALLPDAVSLEENIEFIKAVTKDEVVALAKTVEPELEYILGNC